MKKRNMGPVIVEGETARKIVNEIKRPPTKREMNTLRKALKTYPLPPRDERP